MSSLKPFCRARNWASIPRMNLQFTYSLWGIATGQSRPLPSSHHGQGLSCNRAALLAESPSPLRAGRAVGTHTGRASLLS